MAAGDLTRDTGSPVVVGNQWCLTGTLEADNTFRVFALGGTGCRIVDCQVWGEDDSSPVRVRINENAAGTATLGSVAVESILAAVSTYRYRAHFLM